jgi:putative membrane protein
VGRPAGHAHPLLVFQLGFWLGWYEILLVQWSVWLLLSLLFHWTPIKMRLIPNKVRRHRAALMARLQFVEQGLHRTWDRLGVLIFVSVAEHYVEILVDDGSPSTSTTPSGSRSSTTSWPGTQQGGRAGFLECVERTSAILTDAFPATRDQNELPDSLIILDKP